MSVSEVLQSIDMFITYEPIILYLIIILSDLQNINRRELATETVTSKGVTQPMCMAQYYRIFATYRAPGIPKDSQFRSETEYTKSRPHIIVACRGHVRFDSFVSS